MTPTSMELLHHIDHTLLRPDASRQELEVHCQEAVNWGTASVCILPFQVALARPLLPPDGPALCTVLDFPLGSSPEAVRQAGLSQALEEGADEVDLVLNRCWLREDPLRLRRDLEALRRLFPPPHLLKVILETGALTPEEIDQAVDLCLDTGMDFAKTSTGLGGWAGADPAIVARMAQRAQGSPLRVKASGGIATREAVETFLLAGAERIGMSRTAVLLAPTGVSR